MFASLALRALYRVKLHPLASFPGPSSRAISHIPHALSGVYGRQSFDVRDLHARYGDLVRIAPDELSFITPGAWRDIYGHSAARLFARHGYAKLRPDVDNLLTAPDDDHARQRSALSHAFSERALVGQEPLITGYIEEFLEQLAQRAERNENVDMVRWLEFVTFDIIGDLALSTQFGCVKSSDYHPWVALLMSFFKSVTYVINAQAFGPIMFALLLPFAPFRDLRKGNDHVRMSAERVQERLALGEDPARSDFWTYILRHRGEKNRGMSDGEMESNAAIILPAGTETISTTLSGTLYLLSKTPSALAMLRRELESHFDTEKDITMTKITKLPYLQAVLDESLRMYAPFSGGLKRKAPREGSEVSGHFVPGNVRIPHKFLPACSLHSFYKDYRECVSNGSIQFFTQFLEA